MVRAGSVIALMGANLALVQSLESKAIDPLESNGFCEDTCMRVRGYDYPTCRGLCHGELQAPAPSLESNGFCEDQCMAHRQNVNMEICKWLCRDGLQAGERCAGVPSWPHTGATKELPQAILAFYAAVKKNSDDMVSLALDLIDEEAYWSHPAQATAIGKEAIGDLFRKGSVLSVIEKSTTVQYVATEGDAASGAASYVITRTGEGEKDHKRDCFVVIEGKIKMVWTTNGNKKDPTMDDGAPWYDANQILVSGGEADADAIPVVQTAIDVYFNSFQGHDASGMQSAYHETNPLFMPDFEPERKAPYPCGFSSNCGTIPYWNNYDEYLGNFEVFVEQPSLIQLEKRWTPAGVYGDFAFVSSVSYGCEGNYVTPDGYAPAPNRELFIATKNAEGQWKIRFYSFSIDPKSPISPPVEICHRNMTADVTV